MACLVLNIFVCISLLKILSAQDFEEINENTNSFFVNLRKKYENSALTVQIKAQIDQDVNYYLSIVSRELYASHSRKGVEDGSFEIKGTKVFRNTREILNLNLPGVQDAKFFKKSIGYEQWFGVALNSSHLAVYKVDNDKLTPINHYPVANGSKVRVAKFSEKSFLFIVKKPQSIAVLRFDSQGDKFIVKKLQSIDIRNAAINEYSVLRASDTLFMGVSTTSNVLLYVWQDGIFTLAQIQPYASTNLALFALDPANVYLMTSTITRTNVLRYTKNTRRFLPVQSIPRDFLDVAYARPGSEFLLAASGTRSTIVYKYVADDRRIFAPFQEIGPADRIVAVTSDKVVLLLLLKDGVVDFYQYDGWRFVRLSFKLVGVTSLELVYFKGEELLLVRWFDDNWSFSRINWMKTKDPEKAINDLEKWFSDAVDKLKRNEKKQFSFGMKHRLRKLPDRINMPKLKVDSLNGFSVEKLKNLTNRYDQLESRIAAVNNSLNKLMPGSVLQLPNLRAKIVRLNCTKQCSAENLIAKLRCDNDLSKLRKIDDETQTLRLERVAVRDGRLDGFPCPAPGVKLDKVNVQGSVNGVSLDDLKENALRSSGDQVVTGEFTFEELQVDSLIASNFDAAATKTRQKIRTPEIHARELNLTSGGLLLPLDGEPVTMTGKLELSGSVKFDGLVHLRGHLGGKAAKKILPSVNFDGIQELSGNYTLNNVVVQGTLATSDVERRKGKGRSFKEIAERVIRRDAKVPVRLDFLQNNTVWTNLTVDGFPKLLSKNRTEPVRVTGRKIIMKNVSLADSVYSKLPIPTINANLCMMGAIASDIRTSTLTVGRATAVTVEADDIVGAKELHDTLTDSVASLADCDLSRKSFTGTVRVEKLNLTDFENSPFRSFQKAMFKWYRPDVVEGSLEVDELNVGSLNVVKGIKIPFPPKLDNLVAEENLQVKTINGIDFDSFVKNTVKTSDPLNLTNITFANLEVDEIETTNINIELNPSKSENEIFLGNKIIDGDLEIEGDLSIPNLLTFPVEGDNVSYVVEGSVVFEHEPHVERANGQNLSQLFPTIWMINQSANLTGNFVFNNVTLTQPFDAYESVYTPKFGSWQSLEDRLMSKTKSQLIEVPVHFRDVTVQSVHTHKNSTLRSTDPYLNDLLSSSLKINKDQVIKERWRIDQLIITGNVTLLGKINNLNLSTDVLRRGGERSVTGTKIVDEMRVKSLRGSGFDKWAKDAFMLNDRKQVVTVKGKKTFDKVYARLLNVSGLVNGKKMEDLLLKVGDQTIRGTKIIAGSIHAPSIEVRGRINGVNITELANRQLKKHAPVQSIDSDVALKGNLRILGNVTVNGTFQGVDLTNENDANTSLEPLLESAADLKTYAVRIKAAMKHRAMYWNKFEKVSEASISSDPKVPAKEKSLSFHKLGDCVMTNSTQISCDGENKFALKVFAKPENILISQMLSLSGVPVIIQVSSGQKSRITVHMYDYSTNSFDVAANVRAPGIVQASVTSLDGVAWIVTRFRSHMLVARYEPWTELCKYHLPATKLFALDLVPATRELVLVRDDGMWKLDGLAGPRHIFPADVKADWIETFAAGDQFYVKLGHEGNNNATTLLKARYLGV